MIKGFFKSRLFIIFVFMLLAGFFIGYDYAVITSRNSENTSIKAPPATPIVDEGPAGDDTTD